MCSTTSLPSLPGTRWPGVVTTDRVLTMVQKEKKVSKKSIEYDTELSSGEVILEFFRNVEFSFIAITRRSTLTLGDSIW